MRAPDHAARTAAVLDLPSMPMASPSHPRGPDRFIEREYLIVTYASDATAICAALPAPLEPDGSGHVAGLHFTADLTQPYGRVIHDYLAT